MPEDKTGAPFPVNDSMATPGPGTEFQGAWCRGCGEAITQVQTGNWVHLDPTGAPRCDPAKVRK